MLIDKQSIEPLIFSNRAELRLWFEQNHTVLPEAFIGYYKKTSGKLCATYPEVVEEALCFGWIDGVKFSLSDEVYCNRYTPRKANSIWSAVNCQKMEALKNAGLMTDAGWQVFVQRNPDKTNLYSFEQAAVELPAEYHTQLVKNKKAFQFFHAMPNSYKKPAIHWVVSAKQEATRLKRLRILIEDSEAGRKIKPLSY